MARILLLDDDIAEITAVKRLVARTSHRAQLATTAADASGAIEREPPDLLVVAARCDGGQALSVIQEAAAGAVTAAIPVIVLGDAAGLPARVSSLALPLDPEQLWREIERLLAASSAAALAPAPPPAPVGSSSAPPPAAPAARSRPNGGAAEALRARAAELRAGAGQARRASEPPGGARALERANGRAEGAEDPRGWADELAGREILAGDPPPAPSRDRERGLAGRSVVAGARPADAGTAIERRLATEAREAAGRRSRAGEVVRPGVEDEEEERLRAAIASARAELEVMRRRQAPATQGPAAPAARPQAPTSTTASPPAPPGAAGRLTPAPAEAPMAERRSPAPARRTSPTAAPSPASAGGATPAPAGPSPSLAATSRTDAPTFDAPAPAGPARSPAATSRTDEPLKPPGPPRRVDATAPDGPGGEDTTGAPTPPSPPEGAPVPSRAPEPTRPPAASPAAEAAPSPSRAPEPSRPVAQAASPAPAAPPIPSRVSAPPPAPALASPLPARSTPPPAPALASPPPARSTPPPAPALPPPPEELRAGTLADLPAPRLLALAAQVRLAGRLDLEGEVARSLWFEGGRVVGATSADPAERIEALAVRLGLVTRDQHQQVAAQAASLPARRAALLLLDAGFLKPAELGGLVRRRTEEVVFGIFGDAGARFRWTADEITADERGAVERPPLALAVEGVRRRWSAPRLDAVLGGPDTLLTGVPDGPPADALALSAEERQVAALADGLRTVQEIERASPLDALGTRQVLAALVQVGALAVRRLATRASPEATRQLDLARLADKLDQARRCDYFTVLGLPRSSTSHEVREAAARLEEALGPGRLDGASGEPLAGTGELLQVVRDAREVLGDDRLRQAYLSALGA